MELRLTVLDQARTGARGDVLVRCRPGTPLAEVAAALHAAVGAPAAGAFGAAACAMLGSPATPATVAAPAATTARTVRARQNLCSVMRIGVLSEAEFANSK